jgi:hypothetical protein
MSDMRKQLTPGTLAEEKANAHRFFTLNNWQYIVILGIAISGLAAFITTYNAVTKINKDLLTCENSVALKHALNTKFLIVLILSCIAVFIGILLAWLFRANANQRKLLTIGITTMGIFGILYAIGIKFRGTTNNLQLGISWITFLAFLILGFFFSSQDKLLVSASNVIVTK